MKIKLILTFFLLGCWLFISCDNTSELKGNSIIKVNIAVCSKVTTENGSVKETLTLTEGIDSIKVILLDNDNNIIKLGYYENGFQFLNLEAGLYKVKAEIVDGVNVVSDLFELKSGETFICNQLVFSDSTENANMIKIHYPFPNPFTTSLMVRIQLWKSQEIILQGYKLSGNEIPGIYKHELLNAGQYILNFNTIALDNTIYLILLKGKEFNSYTFVVKFE